MVEQFPHVLNVIGECARLLAKEFIWVGEPLWLSDGYAFDIPIADSPGAVLGRARKIARDAPVDINVVPANNRRKKLLVADMDSTIIGCECLDELADMAGFGPRVAAITEQAMRGDMGFEPALRERVALLKGLPVSILERTCAERVRLTSGAMELVATMRAHGAYTLLVSGGFSYFTRSVAHAAGFDAEQANVLLDDGVSLTGKVREPILGRDAKLKALEDAAARLKVDFADTLAVGDGANDLGMVGRAGLGVAYHAKPIVAQAAAARIDHGDLTSLLYLQGFGEHEIVGPQSVTG